MSKTIGKIFKFITSVVVALVVVFAILIAGVRLFGIQVFTVLSGSMEPEIKTGSLIYVKDIEPEELKSGDIITFMLSEETTATHRIIEIIPDDEDPDVIRFRTKGDANDNPDASLVHCDNVIGKPIFWIPYLGYVASYIQSPPGIYVAIVAGAVLIFLVYVVDTLTEDEDEDKKKKKKKEDTAESDPEPAEADETPAEPEAPEEAAETNDTTDTAQN